MIIDCQVHVWLPDSPERPLFRGTATKPHLDDPLRHETLLAMMDEAGVDRAVLIPPSWEGNRIDYPLEAARMHPGRFGVVARVSLDDPQGREIVARWGDEPALLGVRVVLQRAHERACLKDGTADSFWPAAEKQGIPVMVHAAGVLDDIAVIAARHPGLTLLIDHLGTAGMRTSHPDFRRAIDKTASLARHPNVHVKLTSLPSYSVEDFPFPDVDEPVRILVDAFGANRCCWGTDLTKLLPRHTYRTCIDHVNGMSFLTASDREAVLGRSIARLLGWR